MIDKTTYLIACVVWDGQNLSQTNFAVCDDKERAEAFCSDMNKGRVGQYEPVYHVEPITKM